MAREARQNQETKNITHSMIKFAAKDIDIVDMSRLFDPSYSLPSLGKKELVLEESIPIQLDSIVPSFKRIRAVEIDPAQIFSFKNAGSVYMLSRGDFHKLEMK